MEKDDVFEIFSILSKVVIVVPIAIVIIGLVYKFNQSQNSPLRPAQRDFEGQAKLKTITVLFVGRLVPEKGLLDLQKAVNQINNSLVKLRVVGNNSVDYQQMPKIYQQANIFVLPSKTTRTWEEQYGMVLVEAMASGLPIVAYGSGAIPEIIDKAGILVKEGNIDQLAYSIYRLIENENLRQKLGKMSRRRTEKFFNCRKTAKQLTEIYENISRRPH